MEKTKLLNNSIYLLSVNECAEILRIRRTKIYQLIKSKILQGVKIGYDYRVQRASLEKLIGMPIPDNFFADRPSHRHRLALDKVLLKTQLYCDCGKVIKLDSEHINSSISRKVPISVGSVRAS
ncbi:MAG TPA: helix-turn-helix domain-containing protein [Oligoflexia bacterium]|nr:helix-turn-helix domain-containing protein [Oligoflexia bacterium]HMP27632.1 helix-turn-helix domain-containing protein [Oligoflexia bacterium]